ncbi:GNAT family N-acetyltransferase [Methylocaldum marinum]|uniref:GNAT family N-acetyltransferase n=1 Tax=Methylocaldum marinum TaxID=1432792 RepID=UPI000E692294
MGECHFHPWHKHASKAEVFFVLSTRYWRRGIATEAVSRVIQFGFEVMRLQKYRSSRRSNEFSVHRPQERLGFRFVEHRRQDFRLGGK